MKNSFIVLSGISVLTFSCSGENGGSSLLGGSSMPEDPKNLVIEWYDGGGMLPESENIYISADSSYWSSWRQDFDQKVYFTVSEEELDVLYQVLLDNEFDRIEVIEEQEVYDRGGTSITVTADGEYFGKNNSGMTFIQQSWWDEYDNCSMAIYDLAMQKIESSKTPVTVTFDKGLLNSGYIYSLNINGSYCGDTREGKKLPQFDTMVYGGLNEFELLIFDPDSMNYYGDPLFINSARLVKAISDTSKVVVFDFRNQLLEGK